MGSRKRDVERWFKHPNDAWARLDPRNGPDPAEDVVANAYEGDLVIYEVGDAGWETHVQTPLDTEFAILDIQDHC